MIGGAFADSSATWRWSFYINLCIGAAAAPVFIFLLPSFNIRPGFSIIARIRELDILGAILVAGAIVSLIMPISFGGSIYAWGSGQIIGLFVCSGVLWIAFIVQQAWCITTTKANRLFPVDFLKSWEMNVLFAQMAAGQVIVYLPIYFIPLYFQFVRNDSALEAGVRLLPFVLLLVFAVMFNGAMMGKLGYYMPWYLLGSVLSLIGGALLHTISVDSSTSHVYGYSALTAFGVGLFSQAGFPIAQVKVARETISQAVAYIGVAQVGGIALALTISNSIFLNTASNRIADIIQAPLDQVQQAISGAGGSFFMTLSDADRARVLVSIVQSIDDVYIMVITAGVLTVILSLFMKREKLFVEPSSHDNGSSVQKAEA